MALGEIIKVQCEEQEQLADHIENVHHMPVIRSGETIEQARERFLRDHHLIPALVCECIAWR